jgi:hypothetical protein
VCDPYCGQNWQCPLSSQTSRLSPDVTPLISLQTYASFGIVVVCESPPYVTGSMVGATVTFPIGVAQAMSPIPQSGNGIVVYFESSPLCFFDFWLLWTVSPPLLSVFVLLWTSGSPGRVSSPITRVGIFSLQILSPSCCVPQTA